MNVESESNNKDNKKEINKVMLIPNPDEEKKKKKDKAYISLIISIISLLISSASFYTSNSSKVTFLADGINTTYEGNGYVITYDENGNEKDTNKSTKLYDGTKVSVINEGRKSSLVRMTEVVFKYENGDKKKFEIYDTPINEKDESKNDGVMFGDIIFNYGTEQHIKSPYVAKSENITDLFFIAWEGFDVYFNSDAGEDLNNKVVEIKFYAKYTPFIFEKEIESGWISVSHP